LSEPKKVTRRDYLKTAGAAVVGLAVGYGASEALRAPTPTGPGVTETVTMTGAAESPIKEVTIGALTTMSGGGATAGQENKRVYDQFIEDYNAAGGVKRGPLKGAKIKLVYADNQTLPEVSTTEAERLITSGTINLMMGGNWSVCTAPTSEVCEKYGFPLLNDNSSRIGLTKGRNAKWFWRSHPHDEVYLQNVFRFLKDLQKQKGVEIKTIGVTWVNDNYGIPQNEYLVNELNKDKELGGYDVLYDIPLITGTPSLDSEVLTIKKNVADVHFLVSHLEESMLLVKTMKTYDVNPKLMIELSSEILDKRFGDTVGGLADGIASRAVWATDVNKPSSLEFESKYEAKWGYKIGDGCPMAAIQVATKMFENVQEASVEPKVLQRAFNSLYVPPEEMMVPWGVMFWPPGTLDAGENMLAGTIIQQYTGAYELHTVWPFDAASKDIAFPVKTWKERGL
jgi:branched-chain amino acid transport system substrate-binding protein